MDEIKLTRNLLDQGYDYDDLRRLHRGGELIRCTAWSVRPREQVVI